MTRPPPPDSPLAAHGLDQTNSPSTRAEHLPDPLPLDPFPLLRSWLEEARQRKVQPNPNAMTLATVDPDGRPSARIVLCKEFDPGSGSLVFYTNYNSRKAQALEGHPWAALLFHWDALDRQARVEGRVSRASAAVSDAYFATRPWESKIGAWSSDQSKPIASRRDLLDQVETTMRRFGIDPKHPPEPGASVEIPRPPHWGGYRIHADRVELWVSGRGRVHDRARWTRELGASGDGSPAGAWRAALLQP